VLVPVAVVGLKAAVTPDGSPLAARATLPLNPPLGVTVIVLVAVPPSLTDTLDGLAERAKLGALTVSVIGAVAVREPLAAVIITLNAPTVAELEAVNVTVLLPLVVAGLNTAVTPEGNPLALRATLPVKPPVDVTEMGLVAVAP